MNAINNEADDSSHSSHALGGDRFSYGELTIEMAEAGGVAAQAFMARFSSPEAKSNYWGELAAVMWDAMRAASEKAD